MFNKNLIGQDKLLVDYFIDKLSPIPENLWITDYLTDPLDQNKHCAMGHCQPIESEELTRILHKYVHYSAIILNDYKFLKEFPESTPKTRVMSGLTKIKEMLESKR